MTTTSASVDFDHLPEADFALLDQALLVDFNFQSLVTSDPNTHPARRALIHLVAWFARSEIRRAAKAAVDTMEEAANHARSLYKVREVTILQKMLETAAALLPEKIELPAEPALAETAATRISRNLREARLVFAAILRSCTTPCQPRAKSLTHSPPARSTDIDTPAATNIDRSHPDLCVPPPSTPSELAFVEPPIPQVHTALAHGLSSR